MPTPVYAQLNGAGHVIGVFASPQDPAVWPDLVEMPSSDRRYADYYDKQVSFMQRFMPKPGD